MTERGTKTLIGVFVLGAIALLVVFTVLLGAGTLGSKNPTFVLYFKTTLKGLIPGSPVYFKGIRIGKVQSIHILPEQDGKTFKTPVVIELELQKTHTLIQEDDEDFWDDDGLLDKMITQGLRGFLGISSVLTGQLCIELDFLPNADPVDIASLAPYKNSPQIPTQLSSWDAAMETLQNIPLQEMLMDIVRSVKSLSDQFQQADISGMIASFKLTSNTAREQMENFATLKTVLEKSLASIDSLARSAQSDVHTVAEQADKTLANASSMTSLSSKAIEEARSAIREASAAMTEMRKSSRSARTLFSEDSAAAVEFNQTMLSLRKAAQALADLATLIELNPNSLIFGRKNQ
ncbi:MAG: MCE family protein [Mailhella sp.]|nr:MCE family protein [Mailhella sp.]